MNQKGTNSTELYWSDKLFKLFHDGILTNEAEKYSIAKCKNSKYLHEQQEKQTYHLKMKQNQLSWQQENLKSEKENWVFPILIVSLLESSRGKKTWETSQVVE